MCFHKHILMFQVQQLSLLALHDSAIYDARRYFYLTFHIFTSDISAKVLLL